jgi:hypothetical protein
MDKKEQPEAGAELQRERKARGVAREGHLEAGRRRARDESRSRSEAADGPAPETASKGTT